MWLVGEIMSDHIPLSLSDLPLLLHFIPADSRDVWVEVGMGIKAEFGTDGWDAWDSWSQSGTGYNLRDAKAVWRSFNKSGTGMGSVIKRAMDAGWRPEKTELTREEKRRFAAEHEARRKAREAEIEADEARAAKMRGEVALACAVIWAQHTASEGQSEYLTRKQVGAFGIGFIRHLVVLEIDDQAERCQLWIGEEAQQWLRSVPKPRPAHLSMQIYRRGTVVVPLRDASGKLWALQAISGDGTKLFPRYGRKAGCFHVIAGDGVEPLVAIAEGYATAASVHMATDWTVVIAFDAGNLLAVGRAARQLYPSARLVFCADDDPEVPGNPGRCKAEAAAQELGAVAVFPKFEKAA